MSAAARSLVVASLAQACQLLGDRSVADVASAPAIARGLRAGGARAVCLVGVPAADGRILHWLDTDHAQGWLAPSGRAPDTTSPRFAQHLYAAVDKGFVPADAAVLATMASGRGDSNAGGLPFASDPARLPLLSWSESAPPLVPPVAAAPQRLDLYAIVESAERMRAVLAAGVRTVQLRIKTPPAPDARWQAMLRGEVRRSIEACREAGAELFVNDHWQLAAELGASGVHLGQEDLLALGDAGRAALRASGLALGISSHSLWELCRARALAPRYIACGPVWPTLTKAMPWQPQGLDNLSWWCRAAGVPVVAIGGILAADRVRDAARCGADGVCIVRGLGDEPTRAVPLLQTALADGRADAPVVPPAWPHSSLPTAD